MKIFMMLFCLIIAIACATVETETVKFSTEVKTSAEVQLVQTVEVMIDAYNARDIKKHVSCYAPDAKIESLRAGGTVTRDQYESTLLGSLANLPFIRLDVLKIIELSPNRRRLEANIASGMTVRPIIYELIQREGNWLVIEQRYPR